MRLSLLGGTGSIGEALALRWARDTDHDVLVGSRDPAKAREAVERYETTLESQGASGSLSGFANEMVADRADVIVLSVPPYHIRDTVNSISEQIGDAIVVSPAVGISNSASGFEYDGPPAGSITQLVADTVADDVSVVGAYHTLPAARLASLDSDIELDVPIVGTDADARRTVSRLTDEITALRAVDAGGLENARVVESLTPLVLTIKAQNESIGDVGVHFQ